MSTGIDGNRSGTCIANEIALLVRQVSQEAERDGRDTARREAKDELALGLEQAEHMHQAADETRWGAVVAGGTMMISGGLQLAAVDSLAHAKPGPQMEVAKAKLGLAEQVGRLSGYEERLFEAAAKDQDAFGQSAAARAKAAGHVVEEANDQVRAAREVNASVAESYKEIMRAQHDSVMATLASRG